jgi:16S rRNA (cytosine1402-N4)-methyltransferase
MHIPVLYQEIIDYLQPKPGGRYIDGTVGAGGHAKGLLSASAPDGKILAFDRDPEAIVYASQQLLEEGERVIFIQASYAEMDRVAPQHGFVEVDGILLDLGLSSRQLADEYRGFSFSMDGPLDMRFDPTTERTAADLVNDSTTKELALIFSKYGEIRQSRRLAEAISRNRPIHTTRELAEVVGESNMYGPRRGMSRKYRHPATLVFQALRIAVNDELSELENGLEATVTLLKPGGRLAVISFHSLEDRLVKNFIREHSKTCSCPPEQPVCTCETQPSLRRLHRKVIRPTEQEIINNPRSRSAKLRVAERIIGDGR